MKRAIVVAGLIVGLLVALLFMGILVAISEDEPAPSAKALEEIPAELIGVYQAAARTCHGLDWSILAAIHKQESGFATGDVTSGKGAQGPMQFLPSTFASYRVDGNGDGHTDINNVVDAIFSAASLLCANGAGDPARLASAIWNYNHSQAYVNEVLTLAASYGTYSLPAGAAFASTTELLRNPRIILTPQARADLEAGIVDRRLVSLVAWITQRHTITITVFKTGHSQYTRSGNLSLYYAGRAVDIFIVDGTPVSYANSSARDIVLEITQVESPLRPSEVGHPFGAIGFPGGFTDADHRDHIHIGID